MKSLPLLVSLLLAVSCSENAEFFSKRRDKASPPSTTATVEETPSVTPGTPSMNGGDGSSTSGGTTGVVDTEQTGGAGDGSSAGSTSGSTAGSTSGSTAGSTSGSTTGTTSGSTTGSTEQAMTEESFTQKSAKSKMLDILWVIDNSASMSDEQDDLARNLNSFIHQFTQENIDFKMAIITTDTRPGMKGVFNPYGPFKLNSLSYESNSSQFFTDFNKFIQVGVNGSGKEKGLEAVEGFAETYSNIFLRKNANLAIIVLSDENDQSPKTPSQYARTIKNLKGARGGLVKVHSIVDMQLSNKAPKVTQGFKRYADVSDLTGGSVSDIRTDFSVVLDKIGSDVAQQLSLRSFSLANKPIADSVKVYVNGHLTTDYKVVLRCNTIIFNEGFAPEAGAEIKVIYKHVKE